MNITKFVMCRYQVALARYLSHLQNLMTDGHLYSTRVWLHPEMSVENMGPNNGLAIFRVFSYEVQNNGHPVRNATVDDILFRAAPIGTYR